MLSQIQTCIFLPTIDQITKTICQSLSQVIDKLIFIIFENIPFVLNFMVDQTAVPFLEHPVVKVIDL